LLLTPLAEKIDVATLSIGGKSFGVSTGINKTFLE